MYRVSAQGVDERMINVYYCIYFIIIIGGGGGGGEAACFSMSVVSLEPTSSASRN